MQTPNPMPGTIVKNNVAYPPIEDILEVDKDIPTGNTVEYENGSLNNDNQEIDNTIAAGRAVSNLNSSDVIGESNSENVPIPGNNETTNGEELPKTGEDFSNTAKATGLLATLASVFGLLFKHNRKDEENK